MIFNSCSSVEEGCIKNHNYVHKFTKIIYFLLINILLGIGKMVTKRNAFKIQNTKLYLK